MTNPEIESKMMERFLKAAVRDSLEKMDAEEAGRLTYGEGNFVVVRDEDGFWTNMEKADDAT